MERNPSPNPRQLRKRLGIPDDAERILIFSESSHWDPDWMYTSESYYERFVRHNLDQALDELFREPRRIYSVECIFFLRLYWDRNPEQRNKVRKLVNEGRLRLTSSGVTTADTLLPSPEAILRDFLVGQEWLRRNGMSQEPRLAYFADSFGCSPALPSLLKAAGFDRTAMTRVDGMFFPGCEVAPPSRFPRPGSTAKRLLKEERSLDFVWRDRNGAQVLCHWNAFTYGQGDMLAYCGISRVYLARLAVSVRSDRHVARRIRRYVARLAPLSRTPYMLCPIGFDFVEPIPGLVALLDRYNRNHYPSTGVWAVNAGLDDYLDLVEEYQERLPVLELDPNPYWTGFYSSRPVLKQRCQKLVGKLLLAEKLSFLPENTGARKEVNDGLEQAWWTAAVSNHHDFITGTSPDRVVEEEQTPWLIKATRSVDALIDRLASTLSVSSVPAKPPDPVSWSRADGRIQITTRHYMIELSERAGGTIVNLQSQDGGLSFPGGVSNDLVTYRDSGGLWRLGLEFTGGIWKDTARASDQPVEMVVQEAMDGLEISSITNLKGATYRRRIWFCNESPAIYFRVEGVAPRGHSVTVLFGTGISTTRLTMGCPGGVVVRPARRIYEPTFWPLHGFVHLRDDRTGAGLAVLQPMPGAVSFEPDGRLELIAFRNATRERMFGLVGIPGNPASGHEGESYAYEYALLFTRSGDWKDNNLPILAQCIVKNPWCDSMEKTLRMRADSIIMTSPVQGVVTAIKPASRGEGMIVRICSPELAGTQLRVRPSYLRIAKAFLCDARERDLESLEVENNTVLIRMPGTTATLRLLLGEKGKG